MVKIKIVSCQKVQNLKNCDPDHYCEVSICSSCNSFDCKGDYVVRVESSFMEDSGSCSYAFAVPVT